MCNNTFEILRDFIYEKSGIFFKTDKKYLLESKLNKRIKELKLKDYNDYLKYIKINKNELYNLFDAITINETYFFRHFQQFEVLSNVVVPELLKQKPILNIWSAACSSGEEPYSIVIALMEKYGIQVPIRVLASDISKEILEKALKGIYNKHSLRELPNAFKKKYFDIEQNSYRIKDFVKNKVTFEQINIVEDTNLNNIGKMDIVFLRNVLIYFNNNSRQKVIDKIYNDILNKNGYLLTGTMESISVIKTQFKTIHLSQAIVYKK